MSSDELKVFEAGEDILASDTNDNNNYLKNRIDSSVTQLLGDIDGLRTNVESLQSSLSDYVTLTGTQTISGNKTFSGTVSVPNSSTLGTALNTTDISKSNNGYLKLGNGVIVQWGNLTKTGTSTTLTLPTAFSSASSWGISVNPYHATSHKGDAYGVWLSDKTESTIVISDSNGAVQSYYWVAIGY